MAERPLASAGGLAQAQRPDGGIGKGLLFGFGLGGLDGLVGLGLLARGPARGLLGPGAPLQILFLGAGCDSSASGLSSSMSSISVSSG